MRIENRRSKVESVITKEEWELMKEQGVSSLFKVIDKEDNIVSRINIPREITEFKLTRPERIIPVEKSDIQEAPTKPIKPIKQ